MDAGILPDLIYLHPRNYSIVGTLRVRVFILLLSGLFCCLGFSGAVFFCCLSGGPGPAQTAKEKKTRPRPNSKKKKHAPAPSERFFLLFGRVGVFFFWLGVFFFCCLGGGVFCFLLFGPRACFFFAVWAGDGSSLTYPSAWLVFKRPNNKRDRTSACLPLGLGLRAFGFRDYLGPKTQGYKH